MDLKSPKSRKRMHPEVCQLKGSKMYKLGELFKENFPPEDTENLYTIKGFNGMDISSLQNSIKSTPKKCIQFKEDPFTPTTNMKLLTTLAATLEYANCSTPKSTRLNQNTVMDNTTSCDEENSSLHVVKPSRKEKSLALVCFKFLDIYPLHPEPGAHIVVSLDEASQSLKVERRRLYDIINVFESIDMLNKLAKNRYVWYGANNLLKALHKIKAAASDECIERKLQYVLSSEKFRPIFKSSCILDEVQDFSKNLEFENNTLIKELIVPASPLPEVRKEKSLALMSQKFLMLFLVSPSRIVSLNVAAKVLNGFQKNGKGAQIKTQIRRLYDIANVLSSIGLIQKEVAKSANGKKPAFKYIGPDLEDTQGKENGNTSRGRLSSSKMKPRSLIRHSSFQEICAVAELEHQRLCLDETPNSAPPFEKNMGEITNNKTSFTDMKIDVKGSQTESKIEGSHNSFKAIKPSNVLRNIQPNCLSSKREAVTVSNPIILPVQQKWKVINVSSQNLLNNGSFYILNNVNCSVPTQFNSAGTSLPLNPTKELTEKSSKEKAVILQTIEVSPIQRDTIFKTLNISPSHGQVATIQLAGTTQSSNSTSNMQYNVVKIIDKSKETKFSEKEQVNQVKLYSTQNANNTESNGFSSSCSTRNNSPSSSAVGYNSPLSIPSGYATPVLSSSSDITSFPSNSEVDYILKKIENCTDAPEPIRRSELNDMIYVENVTKCAEVAHSTAVKQKQININSKSNLSSPKEQQVLHHLSDSCSNESLNAEVSGILKGTPLGETTTTGRSRSFLIDEKTILSPIKQRCDTAKVLTPSPLMTPPYIVPDTKFVFNSCEKFQNTIIEIKNTPFSIIKNNEV